MRRYKDLAAWRKSCTLVKSVYLLTKRFPDDERYGIVSQMRRAAVSIPANLAEGFSREHRAEWLQFTRVSYASANELDTHLLLAKDLALAPQECFLQTEEQLQELLRILNGLCRSLASH